MEKVNTKREGKMKFQISDLWSIPNVLSYIRIMLVPVFLYKYFTAKEPHDYYMAALIIIICSATDVADGFIARKFNMITDLGRLLDPIADKLMQMAILVALTITVKYMIVVVTVLVIKELSTFVLGVTIYGICNKRLDGAKWYGKVCTVFVNISLLALIAFPNIGSGWQITLIVVCVVMLLMSWFMYTRLYIIMYKDTKAGYSEFKAY
ncbi:MAG: CDP-alcohol phosphatidyltransferase family protein [Lachnospiraceae bacterium]